jgi:ABC-type transport system involved in cytochrome bd biosynthesis fused ATPase/permease subunit
VVAQSDDFGEFVGFVLKAVLVIVGVAVATVIVIVSGWLIGSSVGFANYIKAFRANVKLESPGSP